MKIIQFDKVFVHKGKDSWGRVFVVFDNGSPGTFDFTADEFIAVTAMLDNDEVYYDPPKRAFYTLSNMTLKDQGKVIADIKEVKE